MKIDVTALIDATTGVVRGSYYYDPFGNVLEQKYYTASGEETSEKINNSITYAGYQYDDETGLHYLNARMYDQALKHGLRNADNLKGLVKKTDDVVEGVGEYLWKPTAKK